MEIEKKESLVVNKVLLRKFGVKTALFLSFLLQVEKETENRNDWFHVGANEAENVTGLSYYQQVKCINELQKVDILEFMNKGLPRKRYFRINHEAIDKIIKEVSK